MNDYARAIFQLVEYELWCNLKILDFLSRLTKEEWHRDFGFGLRTPHRTLFHIANVMRGWSGCVGPVVREPSFLDYTASTSLQELQEMFLGVSDSWPAAARASHEQGLLDKDRRLHQLLHIVTHGMHHRGQLLSMITLMGYNQPFEGGDFGGWSNVPAETA